MLPRRSFLKTSVLAALSAGLMLGVNGAAFSQTQSDVIPPQTAATMPIAAQTDPVFRFSLETFKPYVGGIFTAPNALGERVPLELLSVTSFRPKSPQKLTRQYVNTESFNLKFKASGELPLFTSIHKINHPALGDFQLFLTTRTDASGNRFYEAVINHIP